MSTSKKSRSARSSAPTGAVLYLRVSTGKQAASGVGREAQEAACREHAKRMGLSVLAVHLDNGISGKIERRPGLLATIETVRTNPGAIVIVYSISRLARTQRQLWNLIDERGDFRLPVASATEPFDVTTPMGRAFLGMLATFAQLEADLASERTSDAMAAVRERGVKLGAPSMIETTDGNGERTIDPAKVDLVRRVQRLYATGDYSHRTLADKLNAEGIASVKGGRWHARTVRVAINTVVP